MYLVQTYTDFTLKFETHSNYGETYESGEKIQLALQMQGSFIALKRLR